MGNPRSTTDTSGSRRRLSVTRPSSLPPLAPRKPIDDALDFGEAPEHTLALPPVDRHDVLAASSIAAAALGLVGLFALLNW